MMPLTAFDHVNVLTSNLDAMVEWYGRVLGLHPGRRPDFDVGGAWLYLGDQAYVHLVDAARQPRSIEPGIEHFAFRASNLAAFRSHLADCGIEPIEAEVPGFSVLQLNIHDPDGNHIHIDFDLAAEAKASS